MIEKFHVFKRPQISAYFGYPENVCLLFEQIAVKNTLFVLNYEIMVKGISGQQEKKSSNRERRLTSHFRVRAKALANAWKSVIFVRSHEIAMNSYSMPDEVMFGIYPHVMCCFSPLHLIS